MKNVFQYVLFLLLSVALYYCSEKENITSPISNNVIIEVTSLSHSSARIGEKVIAYGKNLSNYRLQYVMLNDEFVLFNRTSDSTFSLFIPYKAQTGKFYFRLRSDDKDTILTSPTIQIDNDCTSDFCIDWNLRDKFIESDSWITDWNTDTLKWSAIIKSDTIIFSRKGSCHDECGFWNTIAFKRNANNQLPKFLFSVYKKLEWIAPDVNDTLRYGIVKIDRWDSDTEYSGSFSYNDYSWIFFVNNN